MSHAPIPISTHHLRPGLPAAILAACVLLLAVMPAAQDATDTLDVVGLQARLAAIEADAKLESSVKDLLRPKYNKAIAALQAAAENATRTEAYRDAIRTAAGKSADVRAELAALPPAGGAAGVTATDEDTEGLQKEIDSRRLALAGLQASMEKASGELTRVKGRPVEAGARLSQARDELDNIHEQLAAPSLPADQTSPGRVADRILLEATRSKLASELEMLEQEQLSQPLREELLQAQHDLLTRQVENATATLDTLAVVLNQRLADEARRVVSQASMASQGVAGDDAQVLALAAEVQGLAKEFEDVIEQLKEVSINRDTLVTRHATLAKENDIISEQMKLGGAGGAIAQALFDLRHRLQSQHALTLQTKKLQAHLGESRLAAFRIEEKLRKQATVEGLFASRSSEPVMRLLDTRKEVLAKLRPQYGNLVRAEAAYAADQMQFADDVLEIRKYIEEQLFWIRSSPPVSASTLTDIPAGLVWLFGGRHRTEFGHSLREAVTRMPLRSATLTVAVVALLLMRRRIGVALEQDGAKVRRISTDRYAFTARALVYTALLALPISLLMEYAAWALGQTSDPSAWVQGMTRGLRFSGALTFAVMFVVAVCRRGGLGAVHFRWRAAVLKRLRHAARWFGVIYIPTLLVTLSSFVGDDSLVGETKQYFHSVGRASFILAHTLTAVILWKLLRPTDGLLTALMEEHPGGLVSRSRYLWFPLAIACPLALVGLACSGYLISAISLSLEFCVTIALVAGGVILYRLALRWFTIRERKLALANALEERRARREATVTAEPEDESGEVVSVDLEEEKLDLTSIGNQTRQLLQFLFALGAAFAISLIWSRTAPVFSILDTIRPIGEVSLLGIGHAALIIVITLIAARNLPGLLELAVLRATTIEVGTRTAIVTLGQYAVIAIGLGLLFGVLNVDWAKFGWIAAALSVGLGFGLQEVVANFVCGLILLFECPIRVGDVVTVEGTTGTVTKIRMRATTIINWDRQELVVPNKNLITGTLLNWTLSSALTRILITVGVAYGSDTGKARQILLDVATDHPLVVDDPAPMASFEAFADSSLTLKLRAYLPNIDDRVKTITELNAEIDKRFAEAGIEIAFPQRDLHLRGGWDRIAGPASSPEPDGR